MLLSPISKRREVSLEDDGQDIALETSQLMIRSPAGATSMGNMNKRPRYEPSWTLDNLCTHPYSPLASIDLEVDFVFDIMDIHYNNTNQLIIIVSIQYNYTSNVTTR
jgi:hypothetical protein